ncbi:chorismate mutase [Brachyspira sp. CAG:484]|nr:chorismate mutase [Brachyspira sp. CAG:484]
MGVKGIRGAITVEENTASAIKDAVIELLNEMVERNGILPENISHAIFTLTDDLNAAFPAKFARIDLGWENVAMMCFNELNVPGALKMCLRVLIVLNCDDSFTPEFVYLKGASTLRSSN